MSESATLLLVEHDAATLEAFRATLQVERAGRLVVASTAAEALRITREQKPDLVAVAHDLPGANALALCQQLRQDPALEATTLVLLIPAGANDLRFAGLTFGVDETLQRPVEPSELLARLHAMARLRRLYVELRESRARLEQVEGTLRSSFDRMLQLMLKMLELRLPGATDRGRRIAGLALGVANRFGIPEIHLRDLEIAATLHELGRMVSPDDVRAPRGSRGVDEWQYVIGTRAVISSIDGLAGATALIDAMFENWDGTGHPEHLLQGQIPLRSRILRVLVDLFTLLGAPGSPTMERALDDLQNHVGTRYDPMVLVHLRAVLSGAGDDEVRGRQLFVPVGDLQVGMVLAEDLLTDSGVKLLARDTTLTSATLELIRRRHQLEPIVHGAAVFRPGA